jgi:hypothetical protein
MAAKDQHEHHHYHEHHECRDEDRKDDCDDDHDHDRKDRDRKERDRKERDRHEDRDHNGKDRRREHETSHHIHELEKTIKCAADGLAGLGRGSHLQELLRIIHLPGWTTPAELAFVNAILDHISFEVRTLDRLQADLVEAARKVTQKHQ